MKTMRLPKGWKLGAGYRLDQAGLARKIACARSAKARGNLDGYLHVAASNGLALDQVAAIRVALETETK